MNDEKPKSKTGDKTEAEKTEKSEKTEKEKKIERRGTCGVVMPISAMGDYTAEHWLDVRQILSEVAESAGFTFSLVSDTDEVSVIHKTIIQNLYNNEIVIVDVSGKNPNVMFELGMRLAFDKPTIVIKDYETQFIFDTGVMEHLQYPKDLRYQTIIGFKEKLKNKLIASFEKAKSEPKYSPFLKNFGQYKVATLESTELSTDAFILQKIEELTNEVRRNKPSVVVENPTLATRLERKDRVRSFIIQSDHEIFTEKSVNKIVKFFLERAAIGGFQVEGVDTNAIRFALREPANLQSLKEVFQELASHDLLPPNTSWTFVH